MLTALVCLWVGFAAGLVCAAMMAGGGARAPIRRVVRRVRYTPSRDLARASEPVRTRAYLRR